METVIFISCCLIILVLLVALTIMDMENQRLYNEIIELKKELSNTDQSFR